MSEQPESTTEEQTAPKEITPTCPICSEQAFTELLPTILPVAGRQGMAVITRTLVCKRCSYVALIAMQQVEMPKEKPRIVTPIQKGGAVPRF